MLPYISRPLPYASRPLLYDVYKEGRILDLGDRPKVPEDLVRLRVRVSERGQQERCELLDPVRVVGEPELAGEVRES